MRCSQKERYTSLQDVREVVRDLNKQKDGHNYSYYSCEECECWHIRTRGKRQKRYKMIHHQKDKTKQKIKNDLRNINELEKEPPNKKKKKRSRK